MTHGVHQRLKSLLLAAILCLHFLATERISLAQIVRPPDLGVWLKHERAADGTTNLVVADLLPDGILAQAGLREGDRVVSASGKPIDRDQQFIQAFLTNPTVTLVIARGEQRYSLALKSSSVMDAMVPLDPYYQTGFLLEEHDGRQTTVHRVFPATVAFYAGLKPGDVITSLNDQPLTSRVELTKALQRGGRLNLCVTRNGQPRILTLMIATPAVRLRAVPTADSVSPGGRSISSAQNYVLPAAPLLAPPSIRSAMPAISSPPPAIPVLPPPGAVPGGTYTRSILK